MINFEYELNSRGEHELTVKSVDGAEIVITFDGLDLDYYDFNNAQVDLPCNKDYHKGFYLNFGTTLEPKLIPFEEVLQKAQSYMEDIADEIAQEERDDEAHYRHMSHSSRYI